MPARRLLLPFLLPLVACGPADGPLTWTIALHPAGPDAVAAEGRAVADVRSSRLRTELKRLAPGDYELVMLLGSSPIRAQGARAARSAQEEPVPEVARLPVGTVPVTAGEWVLVEHTPPMDALANAVGLVLQRPSWPGLPTAVLAGRIGNIDELAPEPGAPVEGDGHKH